MNNTQESELIIVTDWEKTQSDDFYLSDEWIESADEDQVLEARKLAQEGNLFVAYIVKATNYAVYVQMDADQVFIDDDMNVISFCESSIIGNNHTKRALYEI